MMDLNPIGMYFFILAIALSLVFCIGVVGSALISSYFSNKLKLRREERAFMCDVLAIIFADHSKKDNTEEDTTT